MTDKTQPTAHAEITAPISADLRRIEQEAQELPEPSPTADMNLGQRILHVGGRENAAGYIEFGGVAAVRALVGQVLRDLPSQAAAKCLHRADAAHDPAIEKPEAGRYVLAWTEGAKVPIRAMWAPQFFLEMADDDAESGEYCEAKDQYFCPEGWYENNAHEETHWNVDRPVIAWTELPRLDAALQAAPPAPAAVAVPELRLTDEQIEQAFISARDEFMLREIGRTDKKLRLAFGRAVLKAALAATPAQAVAVTDDMALAFHRAISDGAIGQDDVDEIKAGLRAVLCNAAAPAQEHATQLAGQRQWKEQGYVSSTHYAEDMQAVGEALMETIEANYASLRAVGWERPSDSPAEIVVDLLNLLDEAKAASPAQAQEDARDAGRWRHFSARGVFPKNVWNNGNAHWQYGEIRALTAEGVADAAIAARAAQGGA